MDWVLGEHQTESNQMKDAVDCHSVAFGDRPAGNDKGLTTRHEVGVPFVSVCELPSEVPDTVKNYHVGNNAKGSAAVIAELVKQLEIGGSATRLDIDKAVNSARNEL